MKITYTRIKRAFLRRYRHWLMARAKAELQKKEGLWKILTDFNQTVLYGCHFYDYLVLYNYIRKNKPKEILECGTGTSTVIMAYALMENERDYGYTGRITSMEETQKFYEISKSLMPEHLKKYVEFHCSPKVEDYYYLFRGVRYKDVPQRQYDFVFIDGPTNRAPSDDQKVFSFNFINVMQQTKIPVAAIIDCRYSTGWVLNILLGGKVRYDYIRDIGYIKPCFPGDLLSIGELKLENKLKVDQKAFLKKIFKNF